VRQEQVVLALGVRIPLADAVIDRYRARHRVGSTVARLAVSDRDQQPLWSLGDLNVAMADGVQLRNRRENALGLSFWRVLGVEGRASITPSSRATLRTLRNVAESRLRVEVDRSGRFFASELMNWK